MKKYKRLEHGMLLDAKSVMDNALDELRQIEDLIPSQLHGQFEDYLGRFEDYLVSCDVSEHYEEKVGGKK